MAESQEERDRIAVLALQERKCWAIMDTMTEMLTLERGAFAIELECFEGDDTFMGRWHAALMELSATIMPNKLEYPNVTFGEFRAALIETGHEVPG